MGYGGDVMGLEIELRAWCKNCQQKAEEDPCFIDSPRLVKIRFSEPSGRIFSEPSGRVGLLGKPLKCSVCGGTEFITYLQGE